MNVFYGMFIGMFVDMMVYYEDQINVDAGVWRLTLTLLLDRH